eukprot:gene10117-2536_t
MQTKIEAITLIKHLNLTKHVEGGYYSETTKSKIELETTDRKLNNESNTKRSLFTSIYWLLEKQNPILYLAKNTSDLLHYYHGGCSTKLFFVSPEGKLEKHILGMNIEQGERPQILCPGGYWKAGELILTEESQDWAFWGEAVYPGFDYVDLEIGTSKTIETWSTDVQQQMKKYIVPH